MEALDFRKQYEAMTNDELMNLAMDSERLSPDAKSSLGNELSRRGISRGEINEYGQEQRSADKREKKYNPEAAYFLWPSLRWFLDTLDDWKKYRHQTGEWPSRSIAFYFLDLLVEIAAVVLIVWYGIQHGWSTRIFVLAISLLILIDVVLSGWLRNRIRLSEIARHRHERGL